MTAILRVLMAVCVGLWASAVRADLSCDWQGEISLADGEPVVAQYEAGKTVVLTGLAVKPALQAPVKANDRAKACAVAKDHFDAFKKTFDQAPLSAGKLSFELPKATGCLAFKLPQGELRIELVEHCESADIVIDALKNAGAIQKVQSNVVSVENKSDAEVTLTCERLAPLRVAAHTRTKFTIPQEILATGKLKCEKFEIALAGNPAPPPAAGGTTASQPTAAEATTPTPKPPAECSASVLSPAVENESVIDELRCSRLDGDELTLCVNLLGRPIGPALPPLREGQTVMVKLVAPTSFQGGAQLDTRFERTLIVGQAKIATLRALSGDFTTVAQNKVALRSKGKLHVSVTRQAGTATFTTSADGQSVPCAVPATTTPTSLTFEVSGHYFFSAGVMVAYTHLQQRSFSRQTGDDGVVRIGQQDSSGLDYVINVVGFPWGVDDEHDRVAAGILFGTSAGSLGKRWYAGAELSSPIGLGLSGGAAVSIVKKLDEPLVAGQPFSGDQLATHDVAEPTWYVGVNLQAALFEAAFGALFDDDDDDDDQSGGGTQ